MKGYNSGVGSNHAKDLNRQAPKVINQSGIKKIDQRDGVVEK